MEAGAKEAIPHIKQRMIGTLYGLLSSSRRVSNLCAAFGSPQCEGSFPTVRSHRTDQGAWDDYDTILANICATGITAGACSK